MVSGMLAFQDRTGLRSNSWHKLPPIYAVIVQGLFDQIFGQTSYGHMLPVVAAASVGSPRQDLGCAQFKMVASKTVNEATVEHPIMWDAAVHSLGTTALNLALIQRFELAEASVK